MQTCYKAEQNLILFHVLSDSVFPKSWKSFPNFINKGVNNHVLRPRSRLYNFYKRVSPGSSLQHGDVVAQFHNFFPISSLSNDLRCKLGNMEHKKGRQDHQMHPILQKELSYMYWLKAAFFKFIFIIGFNSGSVDQFTFFWFWGNVNS